MFKAVLNYLAKLDNDTSRLVGLRNSSLNAFAQVFLICGSDYLIDNSCLHSCTDIDTDFYCWLQCITNSRIHRPYVDFSDFQALGLVM